MVPGGVSRTDSGLIRFRFLSGFGSGSIRFHLVPVQFGSKQFRLTGSGSIRRSSYKHSKGRADGSIVAGSKYTSGRGDQVVLLVDFEGVDMVGS